MVYWGGLAAAKVHDLHYFPFGNDRFTGAVDTQPAKRAGDLGDDKPLAQPTNDVPFDHMNVVAFHRPDRTRTLDDYRVSIEAEVDRMVLSVGRLLCEAKAAHPDRFNDWVENDLPFGLDTARRFMAIFVAYEHLPPETLAKLPKAWQAMFALRRLPQAELEQGITDGAIHPGMTTDEARRYRRVIERTPPGSRYTPADLTAGKLMDFDPNDIDEHVWRALITWTTRRR